MKKFTIPCDFAGAKAPFNIYVGDPADGNHPIKHQATWLARERGGTVPEEVMDSFQKLLDIARENNVDFEELCVYALGTTTDQSTTDQSTTEQAATETAAQGESSGDAA